LQIFVNACLGHAEAVFLKLHGPQHSESNFISLSHFKTSSVHFNYHIGCILILCIGCVKYIGIMIDRKLHSHEHVYYVSSHALKLSHTGLISFVECLK
jgi:hypothetical protein